MTYTEIAERAPESTAAAIQLVDCDVHPNFAHGIKDLQPYLDEATRRRTGVGQDQAWTKDVAASHFSLPTNTTYINTAGAIRRDTLTDGSTPASNPELVGRQLLDENKIDRAVLLSTNMLGLGGLPDPDLATALANAYNEWLYEHWLQVDPRYRGAIVIAPHDMEGALATIKRFAALPGFVQIHIPMVNRLLGERYFWPLYAAAQDVGMPIAVHPNAIDGVLRAAPAMAGGQPTYYSEWHTGLTQVFQANVISLIMQGIFERFPALHVIITEGGFAWLPDIMWRADKDWRSLRDELPWMKKAPSEYIVEHIRFTTQPFVEPKKRSHLEAICDIVSADRILLFSTDYPHWDFDSPERALNALPENVKQRVFALNALEVYGDRLL